MPQSRNGNALSWRFVARVHLGHSVFGLILAAIAWLISSELFYWLLPITAGLALSIPLSWLSGACRSKWFSNAGLLLAPEEKHPDPILVQLQQELAAIPPQEATSALTRLIHHPELCAWHIAQLPSVKGLKPEFHVATVTAEWKVQHAHSLAQLETWLESAETMAVVSRPDFIEKIKAIGK